MFNPYNILGVGLHDHILHKAAPIAPDWFPDAFLAITFGLPCYILTEYGIQISSFPLIQKVLTVFSEFFLCLYQIYK